MAFNQDHIKWFRDASPYIDAHRGKTFVLCLHDGALQSPNLDNIVSDIVLLNTLGIKLVLVFGAEQQVIEHLDVDWPSSDIDRITSPAILDVIIKVNGALATSLVSKISASHPESPRSKLEIPTVSGNFLRARPIGIINGVDHFQTGLVRRVNTNALSHQLDGGSIVVIPTIGYSPSGEIFYLGTQHTASQVAQALQADKLIFMSEDEGLRDVKDVVINELDLSRRDEITLSPGNEIMINACDQACRAGVTRCHLISYQTDGALLEELFTRDGCGTQIVGNSYEQIRSADMDDVLGILRLIEPLEKEGVLVKRSRELLEAEIEQFIVIERDGLLISCAALFDFNEVGEVACVVTHPDYRKSDRGDRLLDAVESRAKKLAIKRLFVLTTQSLHWFIERGFKECAIDQLPIEKRKFYNFQRNSKALEKDLL